MINIACSSDENYLPHLAAMLHSLFSNNQGSSINFYLLHKTITSPSEINRISDLCLRFGANFHSVTVDSRCFDWVPVTDRYPEEAWYRLKLPSLLCDIDRVVWIDADTIILDNITDLWNTCLNNQLIAATPSPIQPTFRNLPISLGIFCENRYFNSGVMIMNLKRMREQGTERILKTAFHNTYHVNHFADQDVFNAVFHSCYRKLDLKWNVRSSSFFNKPECIRCFGKYQYQQAILEPKIIHFTGTGSFKPWNFPCSHPYKKDYYFHRKAAGWKVPPPVTGSFLQILAEQVPMRLRVILGVIRRGKYKEAFRYLGII